MRGRIVKTHLAPLDIGFRWLAQIDDDTRAEYWSPAMRSRSGEPRRHAVAATTTSPRARRRRPILMIRRAKISQRGSTRSSHGLPRAPRYGRPITWRDATSARLISFPCLRAYAQCRRRYYHGKNRPGSPISRHTGHGVGLLLLLSCLFQRSVFPFTYWRAGLRRLLDAVLLSARKR